MPTKTLCCFYFYVIYGCLVNSICWHNLSDSSKWILRDIKLLITVEIICNYTITLGSMNLSFIPMNTVNVALLGNVSVSIRSSECYCAKFWLGKTCKIWVLARFQFLNMPKIYLYHLCDLVGYFLNFSISQHAE